MQTGNVEDVYPLSSLQEGLLFHTLEEPGAGTYVVQLTCRLQGTLDREAFERACHVAVAGHPVLRTAFVWQDVDQPVQIVCREVAVPIAWHDWSDLDPDEQEARAETYLRADRERGFDPCRVPLLRLALCRLSEQEHRLFWSHHHLLLDGWSLQLLVQELFTLYEALRNGSRPALPPPRPFRDYVAWLRQQDLARAEAFWRDYLDGFTSPVRFVRPPPSRGQRGAATVSRQAILPAEATARLRDLARENRVTLYTVVQAAWGLVLSRYHGDGDVVFGVVFSGRPEEIPGVERMLGPFINTLPVRVRVDPAAELLPWLRELQEDQVGVRELQYSPLRLVQGWSQIPRGVPLFETLLDFTNFPRTLDLDERGMSLEASDARFSEQPNYPLALIVSPAEELSLKALVDSGRLEASAAARLLRYLRRVLEEIAHHPNRRLGEIPWLGDAERFQLLLAWNDTRGARPAGSLPGRFRAQCSSRPHAVAVELAGRSFTYAEVGRRASRLARRLRSLGVDRGSLVGVYLDRCWEMVPVLLGILEAGGAYVPLDSEYPKERVRWILASLGVRWLVAHPHLAASADGEPDLAELPDLVHLLLVAEGPEPPAELARGAWSVGRWDEEVAATAADADAPPCGPGDLAYIVFTSGSTGRPKGVVLRHGPVLNLIDWVNTTFEVGPRDRVLFVTSLCFDLSAYDVFGILAAGGIVRIASRAELSDPERIVGALCGEPITFWDSAPAALQQLTPLFPEPGEMPHAGLRLVFLSGDWIPLALPDQVREVFPSARVIGLGGATEAAIWSNAFPVEEVAPHWVSIPYGRPITNARYHVLDDRLGPCPIGVEGDLFIAGDCLASGYAREPGLTASKFLPDLCAPRPGARMYRTGDRARRFADGVLQFMGRRDHQVKIRGFRIELGEIESVLAEHDRVRETVVLAREDEPGRKQLVAYVVPKGAPAPEPAEVRELLASKLPDYMVPASFVFLDALPVTANGKVDRRALPPPASPSASSDAEAAAPRTSRESALAELWQELLNSGPVGIHDNFFELGGDSILSIQLVSRARKAGLFLTPGQVFEHQTIAELARAVGTEEPAEAEPETTVGDVPLTPIQHWFFEREPVDPHHFNQALLFELREELAPGLLAAALPHVLDRHDALRFRYEFREGQWHQSAEAPGGPAPFAAVDLSAVPAPGSSAALAEALDQIQESLDLGSGPLLRVVLLHLGPAIPDRLLLVIHHLVVDGVSWRILLEDLEMAHRHLAAARPVELPPRTTPFRKWAEHLATRAQSPEVREELPYWSAVGSAATPLPVDLPGGDNCVGSARSVTRSLETEETRQLLADVPEVYRTRINDVLLTALEETVARWTGVRGLLVDLEGHGRDRAPANLDLSRTVGWLTCLFPVWLDPGPEAGPGERLKAIKECLRAVPGGGEGHGLLRYLGASEERRRLAAAPRAAMAFNYLGQLDQAIAPESALQPADGSPGATQSPRQLRRHALAVSAGVVDGRLRTTWTYSGSMYRGETVEGLAEGFRAALRELIEHCLADDAGARTPSDFPLAALDQASVDRLVGTGRHVEDLYPLSPIQQGMLFHGLQDPRSGIYLQQLTCLLEGELDPDRLREAWQGLVDRHPVLRTSFVWRDLEEPLQRVHRSAELPFEALDWSALGETERQACLDDLLRADRRLGFEFEDPPLMRLRLIRLRADRHWFIWSHHHLILDGWSLPRLYGEVFAAYDSSRREEPLELERRPPYRRYVEWLARQDLAGAETFWQSELSGFTAPTPVFPERGREREPAGPREFSRRSLRLSSTATRRLESIVRERRLTLNTLVNGAWTLLLSRYSGHDDVVFGSVTSGRPADLEEVEAILGPFINTLPIRVTVDAHLHLGAWLKGLQERLVEIRRYEYSPLRKVQEWSEVPRGTPLFETIVIFENYPVERSLREELGGIRVSDVKLEERTNYPLVLVAVPGEELALELVYDRSFFDEVTTGRALNHLVRLLEAMAAGPESTVGALSPLSPPERHALLREWNDTERAERHEVTLHELYARRASRVPEAVALRCGQRLMSHAELRWTARRIAGHLAASGVGPDHVVALLLDRSPELPAAVLGTLEAGAAFLPLDLDSPPERLRVILEESGARVVLAAGALLDRLPEERPPVLRIEEVTVRPVPASVRLPRLPVDALAWTIFTSGSTGRPKGVMVSHRAAVHYLDWAAGQYGAGSGEGAILHSSPAFDLSITALFGPLLRGGLLTILPSGTGPEGLASALAGSRDLSFTKLTPSHLEAFRHSLPDDELAGRTRKLVLGGEALHGQQCDEWLRHAPGTQVVNEYGPTEATVACATHVVREGEIGPVPIGRPIPDVRLFVLGRDLQPAPTGSLGELCIGGVGLARGYRRRPAVTAESFVPDPFGSAAGRRLYRSGDLVRHRLDGLLEFRGRRDHQVKVRGFRVEPGEVEAALLELEGIRDVLVVARRDGGDGQARLVAYVVPTAGASLPVGDLRERLTSRLPEPMIPSRFVCLDSLPLAASGKVDRAALPAPGTDRPEIGGPALGPRTVTEAEVSRVWVELLGIETIGVEDDFFELGGDSLLAMRLCSRLSRASGVEMSLEDIFREPTVAGVARTIDRLQMSRVEGADEEELRNLLAELEGLSDDEARVLLSAAERSTRADEEAS